MNHGPGIWPGEVHSLILYQVEGWDGKFLSLLDAINNFWNTDKSLKEGYKNASSFTFIESFLVIDYFGLPKFQRSKQHLEEVANAPEDVLSFTQGIIDALWMEYTMGENVLNNLYHVDIFRTRLSRNLEQLFDDVSDELVKACADAIPVTSGIRVVEAATNIICHSSNRIFVGAPLCRDPEYVKLNVQFALHITVAAHIIRLFPRFLKPLVVRFLTNVPGSIKKASGHLAPLIEERQRKIGVHGNNYPDKPACFSSAFSNALFELAARPEYVQPLRKEVERIISEEGWCKEAMTRMMEHGHPKGCIWGGVSIARHMDEKYYDDPAEFKGFRFVDEEADDLQMGITNQMVTPSTEYLVFCLGRHLWGV
ncbi:cytochrome P450 [Hysterangium stoloniferum]|nr:cytochrome P450 [Hysterangium stoloniferum]